MDIPEIRFAKSADLNIAYQRYGSGPDVVFVPPLISNVEMAWEHELWRRGFEFMAKHLRMLVFDKRGIGLSDRFDAHPTLAQRIDDILAVMDAEGVARASLVGLSEGGLMALMFASIHPERVDRVCLINAAPGPTILSATPGLDIGALIDKFRKLADTWGRDPAFCVDWMLPSRSNDPSVVRWMGRYQRQSASPADVRRQIESILLLDASEHLAHLRAPTQVIHATGDRVMPVAAGRLLASKIPGAQYLEVEGEDHFCWAAPNWRAIADPALEFITGVRRQTCSERRFATVMFTDIVGSTETSGRVGDEAWRATLDGHDRIARKAIEAQRGRLIKSTGDGLLALFDTPSAGIACAAALRRELACINVRIRAGLHAGEVIVRDDGDVTGLAVNLAARVEHAASADAIYASSTVRELLLGGEWSFEDRGEHALKGIEGAWRLYQLRA